MNVVVTNCVAAAMLLRSFDLGVSERTLLHVNGATHTTGITEGFWKGYAWFLCIAFSA